MVIGKKIWVIPDGYLPLESSGGLVSHEAICILNMNKEDADIQLTIYFEDREPMIGFRTTCPGERTHHQRLDCMKDSENRQIPRGTPYAIVLKSSQPVVVQHSRMDTTQSEMALMTTMAY